MIESLHRYRALAAADRALVLEAAMLLAMVRLGIVGARVSALRHALDRWVRRSARMPSKAAPRDVSRVAWSVAAVSRRLPFRSTCLVESLAVDAMLRRRGVPCEIRFGVRPPEGGTLSAHAWVEHDGAVVFGARPDLSEYSVLVPQDAR